MADLTVKQHDTYPPLAFTLSDQVGPVDLTGADTIKLILKSAGGTVTGTCVADADQVANKGKGTYTWAAGDTSLAGTYECEFEVTWDALATPPTVETFPNSGTLSVVIEADLG